MALNEMARNAKLCDFIDKLVAYFERDRISATAALEHQWLDKVGKKFYVTRVGIGEEQRGRSTSADKG